MIGDYKVRYDPMRHVWKLMRSVDGGEWYVCGMVSAEDIRFLGRFTDSDFSGGVMGKDARIALGYMAAKYNILWQYRPMNDRLE